MASKLQELITLTLENTAKQILSADGTLQKCVRDLCVELLAEEMREIVKDELRTQIKKLMKDKDDGPKRTTEF